MMGKMVLNLVLKISLMRQVSAVDFFPCLSDRGIGERACLAVDDRDLG